MCQLRAKGIHGIEVRWPFLQAEVIKVLMDEVRAGLKEGWVETEKIQSK